MLVQLLVLAPALALEWSVLTSVVAAEEAAEEEEELLQLVKALQPGEAAAEGEEEEAMTNVY